MQKKSIYNDKYQPLFIQEMDETKLKEFSKILSQKLRHVKLAISKAALGQNKYSNLGVNESPLYKEKSSENEKKPKSHEKYKKENKGKPKLKPLIHSGHSGLNSYMSKFDLNPIKIMEIFRENYNELESQIEEIKKPLQMLIKKTKVNPKIFGKNDSFDSNTEDREADEKLLKHLLR
jgi:hypothetical protein